MSDLKLKINEHVKAAMRAHAKERLGTLRMATAAIKQKEVDERIALSDAHIVDILNKMIKQRRESAAHFVAAGRTDLSAKELAEISVLEEFLPEPLAATALDALIEDAIATTGITSVKEMGNLMATLKINIAGRADMAVVGQKVKARLERLTGKH